MEKRCNICNSTEFKRYKNRGHVKCVKCGSIDRVRLIAMYLDKFVHLKKGMKVLHLAPEKQLFKYIAKSVGKGYHPKDIDMEEYGGLNYKGIVVQKFDLCKDINKLPSNYYDLVIHNHVMEHLPCNITIVLWYLHRSLKSTGLHIFSVPILDGCYEEYFNLEDKKELKRRFGQSDHVRRFGKDDLHTNIGMVFNIEKKINQTLADLFTEEELYRNNIPQANWHRFTGFNLLILEKKDIKIAVRNESKLIGLIKCLFSR